TSVDQSSAPTLAIEPPNSPKIGPPAACAPATASAAAVVATDTVAPRIGYGTGIGLGDAGGVAASTVIRPGGRPCAPPASATAAGAPALTPLSPAPDNETDASAGVAPADSVDVAIGSRRSPVRNTAPVTSAPWSSAKPIALPSSCRT